MESEESKDIPDIVQESKSDEENPAQEELKEADFREKLMANPDFLKQMKEWQSNPKFKEF